MPVAPCHQAEVEREWPGSRRPIESPPGLRLLVPGWPQLAWGQVGRGGALLGSFATALGVAALAWGTWLGWALIAFAYAVHVTSASDAIRQASFPVDARRMALPVVAGTLALLLYLPALLTLIDTAWPVAASSRSRCVYLVNCWAYRGASPGRGDWVWLRLPPGGELRVARVVAVAGQELEWTGQGWRIDGRPTRSFDPLRHAAWPRDCLFRVPDGEVLVEPREDGNAPPASGWLVLVPQDQIIGRAWMHYHPLWGRRGPWATDRQ